MRKCMLVLLALFAIACDKQPVAPIAADSPSFDFMNNPDNGNLRIYRYESGWRNCWTDFSNGLRVCNATYPINPVAEPDCDLQQAMWPTERQEVGLIDPDNFLDSELHAVMKGDVFITVRNTTVAGTCYNNELVAEGWGKLQNTDNDLLGTSPEEHNANAFGFLSHGLLTTPAGEQVSYMGHVRWLYSNTTGLKLLARTVTVTP